MTRIGPTLEELGIMSKPEATLSREEAFFVLVDDLLIYRDARTLRRISLRDLTRIHSDDSGTLRVETPAGTALSASLLEFDPDEVQPFFLRVRDATAYAKAQAKRAQERERGDAPPSPFSRVPKAPPQATLSAPAQPDPVQAAPAQPNAAQPSPVREVASPVASAPPPAASEQFEPYAAYEQPRTFAGRLGSVVRVIKRRADDPSPAEPELAPLSGVAPELPHPGTAAPASQPPTPPPGSISMEEALRPPTATAAVPSGPPAPAVPDRRSPAPAPAPQSPAPATAPSGAAPDGAPPAAPDPATPNAAVPAPATPATPTPPAAPATPAAGLPDLHVWPPRLRLVAGVLLLTAVALLGYYLLSGALAAGLWLLVAGVAGAVFLMAAADTVQVLAAWLQGAAKPGAAEEDRA